MIERRARVTCDKRGKEHEFDPKSEDPLISLRAFASGLSGILLPPDG